MKAHGNIRLPIEINLREMRQSALPPRRSGVTRSSSGTRGVSAVTMVRITLSLALGFLVVWSGMPFWQDRLLIPPARSQPVSEMPPMASRQFNKKRCWGSVSPVFHSLGTFNEVDIISLIAAY